MVNTEMKELVVVTFAILVVCSLIVIFPLLGIWSLNTLFALGIPYNFATWFAALWLTILVTAKASKSGK